MRIYCDLSAVTLGNAELILEVQTNQLQDVTIRAKRKAFSLKDGAFVANVSAVPSLRNSGSIDNLLNRIPFVQGSGGSYSVLGTGGEATLYLDGQRVQDASILKHLTLPRYRECRSHQYPWSPV